MTEVKIYIETTIHGPAQKKGKYMYMLETVRRGQTETRFGTGEGWEGENGLVLLATAASLHRLTRPCKVTIITTCDHVRAMISGGWPQKWAENGWINARGKPVSNQERWKEYLEAAAPHQIKAEIDRNEYKDWMIRNLEREEGWKA